MEKNSPVMPPLFMRARSVCVFAPGFARSVCVARRTDGMSLCPSTMIASLSRRAARSSGVSVFGAGGRDGTRLPLAPVGRLAVNRPACRHEELFADDDPTNDGPTVHVAAPALRSLADASAAEPTSGTQPVATDVFSATTRRSPAVYI